MLRCNFPAPDDDDALRTLIPLLVRRAPRSATRSLSVLSLCAGRAGAKRIARRATPWLHVRRVHHSTSVVSQLQERSGGCEDLDGGQASESMFGGHLRRPPSSWSPTSMVEPQLRHQMVVIVARTSAVDSSPVSGDTWSGGCHRLQCAVDGGSDRSSAGAVRRLLGRTKVVGVCAEDVRWLRWRVRRTPAALMCVSPALLFDVEHNVREVVVPASRYSTSRPDRSPVSRPPP